MYSAHPKHSSGTTRKKETSLSVGCRLVTRFDFITVQEVFAKRGPRHRAQDGDTCQGTEGRAHLRASRKREPAGSLSHEKEVLLRGPYRWGNSRTHPNRQVMVQSQPDPNATQEFISLHPKNSGSVSSSSDNFLENHCRGFNTLLANYYRKRPDFF